MAKNIALTPARITQAVEDFKARTLDLGRAPAPKILDEVDFWDGPAKDTPAALLGGAMSIAMTYPIDRLKLNALLDLHFDDVNPDEVNFFMGELEENAPWVSRLDPVRQLVLIDLVVAEGYDLFQYDELIRAFRQKKYDDASALILLEWPDERGYRLAEMTATGEYCQDLN